ncbi:Tetratricopeptide repeat protein 25 [Amphibalanus amphitrite]|uniref:Outer dynein arm-docking complex subunit 4 n=1 Tax=Amphibalanus amphitrite TaxID=1232801 RepID=A0A6A4W4Q4_AMPAM|nr:Tetratricopeptide repeat protein 25 [Amphibalanus amphitrite]
MTSCGAGGGARLVAPVQAIVLSPDPDEEDALAGGAELWRQARRVRLGSRLLPSRLARRPPSSPPPRQLRRSASSEHSDGSSTGRRSSCDITLWSDAELMAPPGTTSARRQRLRPTTASFRRLRETATSVFGAVKFRAEAADGSGERLGVPADQSRVRSRSYMDGEGESWGVEGESSERERGESDPEDLLTMYDSAASVTSQVSLTPAQRRAFLKKLRLRRNVQVPGVMYTDQARAAAVALGEHDIKYSLKNRRFLNRGHGSCWVSDDSTFAAFASHAQLELRRGDPTYAIQLFDRALEFEPKDELCLASRAKCNLLLGNNEAALKDAELILRQNPRCARGEDLVQNPRCARGEDLIQNPCCARGEDLVQNPRCARGEDLVQNPRCARCRALSQKAEALYALGEFEMALVYFSRGLRLRPDMAVFPLGVDTATEAIENAIGERAGLIFSGVEPLLEGLKLSPDLTEEAAPTSSPPPASKPGSAGGLSRGASRDTAGSGRGRGRGRGRAGSGRTARAAPNCRPVLEELAVDKEYMERLIQHPALSGQCRTEVVKHAEQAITFLEKRQQFWAKQKPVYTRQMERRRALGLLGPTSGGGRGKLFRCRNFATPSLPEKMSQGNETCRI